MENFDYAFKVWLVTVLVTPVILVIILSVWNTPLVEHNSDVIPLLSSIVLLGATILLYGTILSIPSFLLSWWVVKNIKEMFAKVWMQKLVLSGAGAVFIIVTLLIVDSSFFIPLTVTAVLWPGIYILVFIFAVFIFKID